MVINDNQADLVMAVEKIIANQTELAKVVGELAKERQQVPEESLAGKTIGIREFAKKYCYPHGIDWVKSEIFYKFKPDWVVDLYPGRGRGFTIFEKPASEWMEKHREEIDWNA